MRLGFLCVSLLTLVAMASAVDYCKVKCSMGKHTMCLFTEDKPAAACQGYRDIELEEADRKVLVDLHNEYRNKVALGQEDRGSPGPQPAAANMRALKWDKELATIARRWALQCVVDHDKCRNLAAGEATGQNAAFSTSIDADLKTMFGGWCDEVEMYSKSDIAVAKYARNIGHYTQVVWAETDRVGCSRIGTSGTMKTALFCNYAKVGNVLNDPLYKKGKACTMCPKGLKCNAKYPGLCGEDGGDISYSTSESSINKGGCMVWVAVLIYVITACRTA